MAFFRKQLFLLILILCSVRPTTSLAQESIINDMIVAQDSIVSIQALNSEIFKSPPLGHALDRKTGQIVVVRNLSQASYQREGSGVIVHPSGIIVTNAHIVNLANQILIQLNDGTQVAAQVIGFVKNIDLAILKIEPPYPLTALPIADSNTLKLGDEIVTVGSSSLLKQTVSGGKIIGLGRSRTILAAGQTRNDLIQTTINLYQGDSGGPLFDRKGQLIGLMTAKETGADHSSFAIPSNQIAHHLINYFKRIK